MVGELLKQVLRSISIFVKNLIYNQIGWVHVSKIIAAVYASDTLNKDIDSGLEVSLLVHPRDQTSREGFMTLSVCSLQLDS
jgi:hypothetical protein